MGTPWLTNPLANSMVGPLAILLLIMFGGAAIALQVLQRLHMFNSGTVAQTSSTAGKILWQRYRTWIIIALLFAGATLSGPLAIALLCAFLCWQGTQEYAILTGMPTWHRNALVLSGWATLVATLVFGPTTLAFAPALAFFGWSVLALQPTRVRGAKGMESDLEISRRFTAGLIGFWGYLYLGWLPAHLLALSLRASPALVLTVGLGVALSDVGAFCVGKTLSGPKLAPRLSPNKTWGGVLGNILGAALAVTLTTFTLPGLQWWQRCLLVLAIGLGSIWGDLLESLLKRQRGVKDAGKLLPGFGGLLDRIDSLLLVAPLVYYLTLLMKVY
jgi:phosphatidate cytidylyltransferase